MSNSLPDTTPCTCDMAGPERDPHCPTHGDWQNREHRRDAHGETLDIDTSYQEREGDRWPADE